MLKFLYLGLTVFLLQSFAFAQSPNLPCSVGDVKRSIDLPWKTWVGEPPQHNKLIEARILEPALTFGERWVVPFTITLDADKLHGADLHVLVKVTDNVSWFDSEGYGHFPVRSDIARNSNLEFDFSAFFVPGVYQVAFMVYDATTQFHSVIKKKLVLGRIKNDPLPTLDAGLPAVLFIPGFGDDSLRPPKPGEHESQNCHDRGVPDGFSGTPDGGVRFGRALNRRLQELRGDFMMPTARPERTLPVQNNGPVRVDILANFTADPMQDAATWQMLQALAAISPHNGCVVLHGINIERQQRLFANVPSSAADWRALLRKWRDTNGDVINVSALQNSDRMAQFLVRELARGFDGADEGEVSNVASCATYKQVFRFAVVLSRPFEFPHGTRHAAAEQVTSDKPRVFYVPVQQRPGAGFDDVGKVLKPLRPELLQAESPLAFRRSLARLIEAIRQPID